MFDGMARVMWALQRMQWRVGLGTQLRGHHAGAWQLPGRGRVGDARELRGGAGRGQGHKARCALFGCLLLTPFQEWLPANEARALRRLPTLPDSAHSKASLLQHALTQL